MTTIASGRLSETLQALVDARLDTIDRMLLGRTNRQDRLSIVREVESQIFDLLHARDAGALDRDDVLAILARLDPPEAYLPDEATGEVAPPRFTGSARPVVAARPDPSNLSLTSGILGIIAVLMGFFFAFLVFDGEGNPFASFLIAGATVLLGLVAVVMATIVRIRSRWSIVGLVSGIIAVTGTMFLTLILIWE